MRIRLSGAQYGALSFLLLVISMSCDGTGVDPRPSRPSEIPFDRVVAMGYIRPDLPQVFVVDDGRGFVTPEGDGWSPIRSIHELFAGTVPFETIGAIGDEYNSPGMVVDGEGLLMANASDPQGRTSEVWSWLGFPVGAIGGSPNARYYFEKGGPRAWVNDTDGNRTVTREHTVDAMAFVNGRLIEVHDDGRLFDARFENPPDIRYGERFNYDMTSLLRLPPVWRIRGLYVNDLASCDPDGASEFEVAVEMTVDGEMIARDSMRGALERFSINRYNAYVEAPYQGAALLDVIFHVTEMDFTGPDPRMDALTATVSHILLPDGTIDGEGDVVWVRGEALINGGAGCEVQVMDILERVQ
jgi:hypothetical protein